MDGKAYALEHSTAITNDTAIMFMSRGFKQQEPDVVGIIQVAGAMGQAWGLCEDCWKVGPMSMACGEKECESARQQFRPVAFSNNIFAKEPSTWGYSHSNSDKHRSAYMYEISTWFIAMWNREEKLADIEVSSLKAKIQIMETNDEA